MRRRRTIHYRISDLLLIVALAGFAIEFRSALAGGRYVMMTFCAAAIVAIDAVLLLQPKLGSQRCPYCGRHGIEGREEDGLYHCGHCDTHCERAGRHFWILTSPSDERLWAIRFLPRLRTLRRQMRPGSQISLESSESKGDHSLAK